MSPELYIADVIAISLHNLVLLPGQRQI